VKFARKHNIRFVIRNTGHDYLGRSTGAGALSVWIHNLRDIDFINFSDEYYTGPAAKIGGGVQGLELLAAAKPEGRVAVSGECPTVALPGGYTQGGGHSALSTNFGLAADNTLEFEVVTATGDLVTASRTQNSDLYWALSGGGAGNYGIVVSMTVKTHPDSHVGGGVVSIAAAGLPTGTYFAAVDAFHVALADMINSGVMIVYYLTGASLTVGPITAYNKTKAELEAIMKPFMTTLDTMNVPYDASFTEMPTYHDHYVAYFGANSMVGVTQGGSRLVALPTDAASADRFAPVNAAVRSLLAQGVMWIGLGTDVSRFGGDNANAVLPAWRQGPLSHSVLATMWSVDPADWDRMIEDQHKMTEVYVPTLEAATPGSGSYANEADPNTVDYQTVFYGDKYDELLQVKKRWDPEHLFYGAAAVGSEFWKVTADGRMCKASHAAVSLEKEL
jgi:hypothetical protein